MEGIIEKNDEIEKIVSEDVQNNVSNNTNDIVDMIEEI